MIPIEPYLTELLHAFDQAGFPIIVAGGLGIYLKRRWIEETGQNTFFSPLPDARATDDIDSFTSLEIFIENKVKEFRGVLDNLDYKATEKGKYLQFTKPVNNGGLEEAKFDLHARLPEAAESAGMKQRTSGKLIRLGHPNNRSWNTLNAWGTAEAFAIEEDVQDLPFSGTSPAGQEFKGVVRVPHPFASLCMKLRAAADYERTPVSERIPLKRKHAFNVYLLVAMLREEEIAGARRIADKFTAHPELYKTREDIAVGFADPEAGACRTFREQLRGQPGEPGPDTLEIFCAFIREMFGS